MKQIYKKTLVLLLMSMVGFHAFATFDVSTKVKVGNLYYYLDKDNALAEVTFLSNGGYSGSIVIPETVIESGVSYKVTSIGSNAFYSCSSLTSITIPNSVTRIGTYAFGGCSSLTSITIPNSVTEMGSYVFRDCSRLKFFTIPDGVTIIDSDAFENCSSLTSITIPNSVTTIKSYAFSGCSSLKYIVIPNSVKTIGSSAFKGSGLTSIVIPESVESIDSWAFRECNSLTSVTINCPIVGSWFRDNKIIKTIVLGEKVTTIGDWAFYGCSGLTSVSIPNGLTTIGSRAFEDCSSLSYISIPESVTNIGVWALSGTAWLSKQPNGLVYAGKIAYLWKGRMPENTAVVLREDTKVIAENAFSGCSGLTSITIPQSVVFIGPFAFRECSSLTAITIPNQVTSIENYAFQNCKNLTSIVIPENVTSIGDYSFQGCSSLTSVSIPDKVTSIGNSAFQGCSNLITISFPDGLTEVGTDAFAGTLWLNNQPDGIVYIGPVIYQYKGTMPTGTSIDIKDGIQLIKDYAFKGCSGLTSITIPKSVKQIGRDAFEGCVNLSAVHIKDLAAWCDINFFTAEDDYVNITYYNNNPLTIAHHLYLNGEKVKDLVIPDGVTEISSYSFAGCSDLTSVTIPVSLKRIGRDAFSDCTDITAVHIKDLTAWCNIVFASIETTNFSEVWYYNNNPLAIAHHLYLNGEEIQNIIIPDGITKINSFAFSGSSSLTSVTIPEGVTKIEKYAFSKCDNLKSVHIPKTIASFGAGAFDGCPNISELHIKDLEAWCKLGFYESIPGSSGFFNANPLASIHHLYLNGEEIHDLVIPEGIPSVNNFAFSGCSSLTSVSIPESVTSIGYGAFQGCSSLTSVTIPKSVTFIDSYVFAQCSGLKYVTANCPKFNSCFSNCTSLKGITLGENVTSIERSAFYNLNCPIRLLATTPPQVNSYAFDNWNGQYIYIPKGSMSSYASSSIWSNHREKFIEGPALIKTNVTSKTYTSIGCQVELVTHFGEEVQLSEYGVMCNGKKYPASETSLLLDGLLPGTEYEISSYCIFDGEEYVFGQAQKVKTAMPAYSISLNQPSQIKCVGTMTVDENEIVFDEYGVIVLGDNMTTDKYYKAEEGKLTLSDLTPNMNYTTVPYFIYKGDTISFNEDSRQVRTNSIYVYTNMKNISKTQASGSLSLSIGDALNEKCAIKIYYKTANSSIMRGITLQGGYNFTITDLSPEQKYTIYYTVLYEFEQLRYREIYSNEYSFTTKGCGLITQIIPTATTAGINNIYDSEELEMISESYTVGGMTGESKSCTITGLEPNRQYSYTFTVSFSNGYKCTKTTTFYTQPLTFKTLQPKVVTVGNVIVGAESNITNEEELVGFEWRRIDWTDEFESNRGEAILYEGTMEGYIRNLNTDKLWKFRPYYESSTGVRYYGDWLGLDPTNASYFEPTVHTYAKIQVQGNSAEVKGYAMRGTDNVTLQGFMYWKQKTKGDTEIPSNPQIVEAQGNVMTAKLTKLDYKSTYCYTAFVKTSENKTFYGEVQSFLIEGNIDGVEDVKMSENGVIEVARYDVDGRRLDAPQRGLNIIRMSDGTVKKVMVK